MTNQIKLPDWASNLPTVGQEIYRITYKNAIEKFDNELSENIAKAAVHIKFQLINNEWIERSSIQSRLVYVPAGLYITKATIQNGNMVWNAVASDTGYDLFDERMSIQLYKSFIKNLDGHEYVSLAHYPALDGTGEFGKPTQIYIDGDKLKAKGIFHENERGVAAFNAIRKDRRDNVSQDNRIRISIGFWDHGHYHGNFGEWSIKANKPCLLCATGIKEKVYTDGKLDHLALTRIPARVTTEINIEE